MGDNYKIKGERHIIHLFPIGHFQFSKTKKEVLFDLLNIETPLREHLDNLFEMIIPVVNIKKNKIEEEGYANDHQYIEDLDTIKLMYQRRKKLFENGIYRVTLDL